VRFRDVKIPHTISRDVHILISQPEYTSYLNKKRDSEVCAKFHGQCCDTRHYQGLYNIPGTYQIIHTIVSTNEERIVHSWFNHYKT
jgi:hypothetical protein